MLVKRWYEFTGNELMTTVNNVIKSLEYKKVAVIYGETSSEDKLYIKTKPFEEWSIHHIIAGLSELNIEADWLDPTKNDFIQNVKNYDAAFINSHGEYGEDGNLQGLLAYLKVPYTGSGVAVSAIAADKRLSKLVFDDTGVSCPSYFKVDMLNPEKHLPISERFVIKPVNAGSSVGIELVDNSDDFLKTIKKLKDEGFHDIIAETYIDGLAVTVPALKMNDTVVLLPPIMVVAKSTFYDQNSKLYRYISDFSVSYELLTDTSDPRLHALFEQFEKMLYLLSHDGLIRADFIIDENNCPSFLELNSIPGVQSGSTSALSAEAVGIDYSSLIGLILASANNKEKLVPWNYN